MTWNYQILAHEDPTGKIIEYYNLHEVYYDDEGQPDGWTKDPAEFGGSTPSEIILALEMALKDARTSPPLLVQDDKLVTLPLISKK